MQLLPILLPLALTLILTSLPLTTASPSNPDPSSPSTPFSQPESPALLNRQLAAGGGLAATTLAPSQYPISTTAGSLFTINGVTSATWKLYVQTFATTALGTWELGPTPGVGSIGLGDIEGTVGGLRDGGTKGKRDERLGEGIRAIETPVPVA
ncbi:hypothetical protein ONS95_005924 [Cadophora gregata]|uniref:uncharacterized protein n=1 Tax=Cadophora gregata TaxID=51156 RepID=UPI0026DD470F|nr:uncharacterized protein ONS95_005924 [Cadophora gregata]KAK0102301.1 hypothetical protein ONS95_005924 [Cadophora gregata]KAK0103927.1 hypothetical protein ONS96_005034 [Cadophora gregata f. sp. sojae]